MNDYQCSKCSRPDRPTTARLVVWSRERGYLCAVCAGQQAEERGPLFIQRGVSDPLTGFTREQVESSLRDVVMPQNPWTAQREALEAKAREALDILAPRSELRRGYEGWRAPNDPRRS